MLKHRGTWAKSIGVQKGNKRVGQSKGYRVWVIFSDGDNGDGGGVSVYPEDARKFALELLEMADECEKE